MITVGYFIPGVRHFTGYFSGIIALPYRKFALYAYGGALFWVILFLGIGRMFGPQWTAVFHLFETYALWIVLAAVLVAALILVYRFRSSRRPKALRALRVKESSKER